MTNQTSSPLAPARPLFYDAGDGTVLRAWIREAKVDGFTLDAAHDGEGDWIKVSTAAAAFEVITSVDDSALRFRNAAGQTFTLHIILNNGIGSPVSDISAKDLAASDRIGERVSPVQDRVDNQRASRVRS